MPAPLPTHDVWVDDETTITLRRHGNPSGPRLVMTHGNGLSIDLYYPFCSLLVDDYDIVAYDLRNHGWNSASSMQNHNLPTLVHDHDVTMEATDAHYGEKPKVGVFHSISAPTPHCRARTSPRSTSAMFSPSTTTSCPNPRTCCRLNSRGCAPRWCGSSSRKWRTPEHRRIQPRFRSPPDGPAQCYWP